MSNLVCIELWPPTYRDVFSVCEAIVYRRNSQRRYSLTAREYLAMVKASDSHDILEGGFGLRLWPKRPAANSVLESDLADYANARRVAEAELEPGTDPLSQLKFMLATQPFGTLVRDENLQVHWSGALYHSPKDALVAQPEEWVNLGKAGWWADEERKDLFFQVKKLAADLWPRTAGEYCILDELTDSALRAAHAREPEKQP